jgi:hypothetical protein
MNLILLIVIYLLMCIYHIFLYLKSFLSLIFNPLIILHHFISLIFVMFNNLEMINLIYYDTPFKYIVMKSIVVIKID